jgi:acetate kinase
MPPAELAATLEHRSGLLGLAGTADMREILEAAETRDRDAALARDVYVHRLSGSIAAMAAALGGLDALVFTGGVGERAPEIRELAVRDLAFLGIELDPVANREAIPDCEIGAGGARVRTLVVTAREDVQIANEVRSVLGAASRT